MRIGFGDPSPELKQPVPPTTVHMPVRFAGRASPNRRQRHLLCTLVCAAGESRRLPMRVAHAAGANEHRNPDLNRPQSATLGVCSGPGIAMLTRRMRSRCIRTPSARHELRSSRRGIQGAVRSGMRLWRHLGVSLGRADTSGESTNGWSSEIRICRVPQGTGCTWDKVEGLRCKTSSERVSIRDVRSIVGHFGIQ